MKLLKFQHGNLSQGEPKQLLEVEFSHWRNRKPQSWECAGVVISNDIDLSNPVENLENVPAVILVFPNFKDGRAFTQARLLRERSRYRGEIRARGNFLPDQIEFMTRCGFDAFEIADDHAGEALGAFNFSYQYQSSVNAAPPVWRRRLARKVAA